MATGTYQITSRSTVASSTGAFQALTREAAIVATIDSVLNPSGATGATGITGPTGSEVHVPKCDLTSVSGPTGTYLSTYNYTAPLATATFASLSREDAIYQAVQAGPTGPGSGIAIEQTTQI